MIEVEITPAMLVAARDKATEMGRLNNSITRGQGNLAGFIGEQIALQVMGGKWSNTYSYDLVTDDGTRVDVKTKQTSVPPLPHYDCSIANYKTEQECDMFAFVRVRNTFDVGWFLGVISKDDFINKATFFKKGEPDPNHKDFVYKADCYNIAIKQLEEYTHE